MDKGPAFRFKEATTRLLQSLVVLLTQREKKQRQHI
jgi:hypothetical protein